MKKILVFRKSVVYLHQDLGNNPTDAAGSANRNNNSYGNAEIHHKGNQS